MLYPKGAIPGTDAANIADGYLNWKAPGSAFTLIPVNSPTNGNGYWQGDGSSSRLRTQYTPSVNGVKLIQDSASALVWSLTEGNSNSVDVGNSSVTPNIWMVLRSAGNTTQFKINDNTVSSVGSSSAVGMFMAQRRGASDKRAFVNGSQVGGVSAIASTGLPTSEQWVLGGNSVSFSARKFCFAAWGASQAGREAAIYATWQACFTAAGTI